MLSQLGSKKLYHHQIFRFLCMGLVNTVFGYSLFALFIYCGLHYAVASLLSTCIGIFFSFQTLGNFVFDSSPSHKKFWRFGIVYMLTYFFSLIIMKTETYYLKNMYLIGAISIFLTSILTFFLNKYFVFRKHQYEKN